MHYWGSSLSASLLPEPEFTAHNMRSTFSRVNEAVRHTDESEMEARVRSGSWPPSQSIVRGICNGKEGGGRHDYAAMMK